MYREKIVRALALRRFSLNARLPSSLTWRCLVQAHGEGFICPTWWCCLFIWGHWQKSECTQHRRSSWFPCLSPTLCHNSLPPLTLSFIHVVRKLLHHRPELTLPGWSKTLSVSLNQFPYIKLAIAGILYFLSGTFPQLYTHAILFLLISTYRGRNLCPPSSSWQTYIFKHSSETSFELLTSYTLKHFVTGPQSNCHLLPISKVYSSKYMHCFRLITF